MSWLDILFPKYCINCKKFGAYLCTGCFAYITFVEQGTCVGCQRQAIGGVTHPVCQTSAMMDGVFSSLVYKGVVKKLVYQFKYNPHLTDLQHTLLALLYEGLIQKEFFYQALQGTCVLVPIPLHKSKMRKRGYNQAALLAKGLGKKFEIPMLDCLERVKNTQTQVTLSKQEREENIKGAFALKAKFISVIPEYQNIFLVDDVATSGATMKEAAKILKKAGAEKVWGITLAHGL